MAIDINKLAQVGTMAATGGTAQAALGGAQALYGLTQLPKARAEFERAKAAAPSLETPAQFYENYKNAYDGEMARMQNDAIQANLATSVQALQGAGGRALVGGLNQATAQSQAAQNSMLAQERQMRLAAGQQLATAEERAVGRKEARSQQEMAYANQAYQAALGNIGGGLGSVGEGLMYGMSAAKANKNAAVPSGDAARQAELQNKVIAKGNINKAGENRKALLPDAAIDAPKSNLLNVDTSAFETNLPTLNEDLIGLRKRPTVPQTSPTAGMPNFNTTPAKKEGIALTQKEPNAMASSIYSGAGQYQGTGTINVTPEQPAPLNMNPFGDLSPANNINPIPAEYRNDQAMKQINALFKQYQQFAPALGRMTSFRNGGMMTQGAFNHDTNPIDLVQDGQKVGEATGGEYILNPEQAAAIAKQSSFAKNLFKKFERNAKKNK
jgi:hypothetical protein